MEVFTKDNINKVELISYTDSEVEEGYFVGDFCAHRLEIKIDDKLVAVYEGCHDCSSEFTYIQE